MKNKKGFTIIELLAVIILMAIISTIIVPAVIGMVNKSKEKSIQQQYDMIRAGAKAYINANPFIEIPNELNYNSITVTLDTLIKGGFVKKGIVNPETNEPFNVNSTTVKISNIANNYIYDVYFGGKLVSTDSNNVQGNEIDKVPIITIIGDVVVYVNRNGNFNDPGAEVKVKGYTVYMPLNSKKIKNSAGNIISYINTSQPDIYTIEYSHSYTENNIVYSNMAIRTVIVR